MALKAIISDLHSNMEALSVVLEDIKSQGIEDVYCLGDIIGYGPEPVETLEVCVQHKFKLYLRGNHEEGVINGPFGFQPAAREAILWTASQLRPNWLSFQTKKQRWEFLVNLPTIHEEGDFMFVHGSPRDHVMEYLLPRDCEDFLGEIPPKIADVFSRIKRLCFNGHTHVPGVITQRAEFLTPDKLGGKFEFVEGEKYVVNVGSVGQPRDGDNRACYLVFDEKGCSWRRCEYDYRKTMAKIEENPHLHQRLADRLAVGE
jgi:predicted phosphodiesterase